MAPASTPLQNHANRRSIVQSPEHGITALNIRPGHSRSRAVSTGFVVVKVGDSSALASVVLSLWKVQQSLSAKPSITQDSWSLAELQPGNSSGSVQAQLSLH